MSPRDVDGAILHEAIHARDSQAASTKYTPDAVLIAPGGRFEGREQIATFFEGWFAPFSDPDIDEWYRVELDGRGLVASTFSATHTDPYELPSGELLPATGKRIAVRAMETFLLNEEDEITEHQFFYDRLDLLAQLGVTAAYAAE